MEHVSVSVDLSDVGMALTGIKGYENIIDRMSYLSIIELELW